MPASPNVISDLQSHLIEYEEMVCDPELADTEQLSAATQSFLLGYISHLAADEVWITTVFRPSACCSSRYRLIASTKVLTLRSTCG